MLRPSPNHGTLRLPNDDDEILSWKWHIDCMKPGCSTTRDNDGCRLALIRTQKSTNLINNKNLQSGATHTAVRSDAERVRDTAQP